MLEDEEIVELKIKEANYLNKLNELDAIIGEDKEGIYKNVRAAITAEKTRYVSLQEELNRPKYLASYEIIDLIGKKDDNNILIYVEKAGKFVLFDDIEKYQKFMYKLSGCEEVYKDYAERYDVALVDEKHKILFKYEENLKQPQEEELRRHIKKCFGVDSAICPNPKWNASQVKIDMISSDRKHDCDILYKLVEYLLTVNFKLNLQFAPLVIGNHPAYMLSKIDLSAAQSMQVDKIQNSLTIVIDRRVIVNNYGVTNFNNFAGNVQQAPLIAPLAAPVAAAPIIPQAANVVNPPAVLTIDQWIAQNPPGDGEKTIEYFNKYKAAFRNPTSIQLFSKHVMAAGYKNHNNKKFHAWVRRR